MFDDAKHQKQQVKGKLLGAIFAACLMILACTVFIKRNDLLQSISHDPMALLPNEQINLTQNDAKLVVIANEKQNQYINDKVIIAITSPTPEQTQDAVKMLNDRFASPNSPLTASSAQTQKSIQSFIDYYAPHALQLMTADHKNKLEKSNDEQLINDAMSNAMRPVSLGISAAQDPLSNLQEWFMHQLGKSPVQPKDNGEWQVEQNGKTYTLLFYQATQGAFSLNTQNSVFTAYDEAKSSILKQNPNVTLHIAGVPIHAAAASKQANNEISLFGSLSMLGVVILLVLAFKSIKSVLLVTFSLVIGFMIGLLTTVAIFHQIHVVTLVFGTSLIGVAQDYAVHYIATRQNMPNASAWQVRKHLYTSLLLALLTTVFAYACLGIAPFPGLRQIAVFSVSGLIGAWLTVVILFPLLMKHPIPASNAQVVFKNLWINFTKTDKQIPFKLPIALALTVLLATGWAKLSIKDNLKNLQNSPQWLLSDQDTISQIMGQSNSQYFLVTGNTPEELLSNEEQLRNSLDNLIASNELVGYRAISEWLPSISSQKANEALSLEKTKVLANKIGLESNFSNQIGHYIEPEEWLKQPVAKLFQSQWLGEQSDHRWASVISLNGKMSAGALEKLNHLPSQFPQVKFVDNLTNYSNLMSSYSHNILIFIGIAYLGTLILLGLRFKKRAILILIPPIVASALVLSVLGWFAIPIQLFTVLPLLLILGMGVDYGIFLVEHSKEQQDTWLTICLCASSTILSLGVLAFSSTPALHILGLTLTLGITACWVVSAMVGRFLNRQTSASE